MIIGGSGFKFCLCFSYLLINHWWWSSAAATAGGVDGATAGAGATSITIGAVAIW